MRSVFYIRVERNQIAVKWGHARSRRVCMGTGHYASWVTRPFAGIIEAVINYYIPVLQERYYPHSVAVQRMEL